MWVAAILVEVPFIHAYQAIRAGVWMEEVSAGVDLSELVPICTDDAI